MPCLEFSPIVIMVLSFGAVAGIVFVVGQSYSRHAVVHRRLPPAPLDRAGAQGGAFSALVARYLDRAPLGIDREARTQLRRKLLRAGFFRDDAVNLYLFTRILCVIAFPALAYLFIEAVPGEIHPGLKLWFVALAILLAVAGPRAYLARRERLLQKRFRLLFPDFLDLLVVCIDGGLTLDAAFDRVGPEMVKQSRELGTHLEIMAAETRAGRSMIEALNSFADRLGLDEVASVVITLRQSLELGADVGEALRVLSDEIRDKRLLRAQEAANKLTVKMVLPLGLFIFPVILLVIMLPVVIKLMGVLGNG